MTNKKSITYWIFNYTPRWEAASKEVSRLFTTLEGSYDLRIVSMNLMSRCRKLSLFTRQKFLPLPFCLVGLPFVRSYASRFAVNHIFASPGERLLTPRLSKLNTLLTITKDMPSVKPFEKNAEHLRRLKYVVVETERHREILTQLGINGKSIKLIYPGIEKKSNKKAQGPFKIVFATSSFAKHDMLSRGIHLMIHAAKRVPNVQFVLVWREAHIRELRKLIEDAGVVNVKVLNGFIPDMDSVYQSVHAVILPGLEYSSFKPCPHSFLDALAHGKPALVSRPTSISSFVDRHGCGVVFEPTVDSLVRAIDLLTREYDRLSARCHEAVEQNFSTSVYIEKYRRLYESM